MKGILETRREH